MTVVVRGLNRPAHELLEDIAWQIQPQGVVRIDPVNRVLTLARTSGAEGRSWKESSQKPVELLLPPAPAPQPKIDDYSYTLGFSKGYETGASSIVGWHSACAPFWLSFAALPCCGTISTD